MPQQPEPLSLVLSRLTRKEGHRIVRFVWIPEHPRQPLYMAREPYRTGKIGEHLWLITSNACEALQFETKEACEAWIQANPYPMFVAVEHGFADFPNGRPTF